MIGRYRNSPIPLGEVEGTIGSMVLERAIEWHDHAVFASRKEAGFEPVSWHTLLLNVVSLVSFLHKKGIKTGDRVAVFCPNSYAMLVWEMAATSMGAVSVPIFAGYDVSHLDYILTHAEPRAMLVSGMGRLSLVEDCAWRSQIETLVTCQESSYITLEECLKGGSSELFYKLVKGVAPDDVCFIQYTSGTTGIPKGVMLSHRNILSQRKALEKVWEISNQSRFLSYLPWHHSFGGLFERFTALYHGATLYLEDSLGKDIARLVQNWSIVKPTQFFSVPKVFKALVTEARLDAEVKEILFHPELMFVFTAAAPLPRACGEYFKAQNVPVLEGWGLTETSPCVTVTPPGRDRVHSFVGEPIPGCEILTTEDSEILVKGPNVMAGYYKDPERTSKIIDHYGWLHTGDLGEITDFGLRLICRMDGLFMLSNGEKVSSMLVENAVTTTSHWVKHALVLGMGQNFVGALIFPNYRPLNDWAEKNGRDLPEGWDLSRDGDVQALFAQEIEGNMEDVQPKFARVKSFVIIPKELSIEDGELTPSMKVIRHHVIDQYQGWIDAIFHPNKHPDRQDCIVGI